jgi:hypothetical protein
MIYAYYTFVSIPLDVCTFYPSDTVNLKESSDYPLLSLSKDRRYVLKLTTPKEIAMHRKFNHERLVKYKAHELIWGRDFGEWVLRMKIERVDPYNDNDW